MNFIEKYFWIISTFLIPVLYLVMATLFYVVLYSWKKDRFRAGKIQQEGLTNVQVRREYRYGIIALLVFTAMGFIIFLLYHFDYSLIYLDVWKYGIGYLLLSAVLLMLFHDGYFYWTHRLLHQPGWYQRVHYIHHLSSNPSPFTSLAFHPVESIIQAAVLPLMMLIIPAHPFAIIFFLTYMVYKNVRGHAGYEFTSKIVRQKKWNRLQNYSIHHNQHHLLGHGNYGLYFTIWDRLMKTFRKEE